MVTLPLEPSWQRAKCLAPGHFPTPARHSAGETKNDACHEHVGNKAARVLFGGYNSVADYTRKHCSQSCSPVMSSFAESI